MKNEKPVAKSLHTVKVIVQVAQLHIQHGPFTNDGMPRPDRAVELAMETLGLNDRPDPYELARRATEQLEAFEAGLAAADHGKRMKAILEEGRAAYPSGNIPAGAYPAGSVEQVAYKRGWNEAKAEKIASVQKPEMVEVYMGGGYCLVEKKPATWQEHERARAGA